MLGSKRFKCIIRHVGVTMQFFTKVLVSFVLVSLLGLTHRTASIATRTNVLLVDINLVVWGTWDFKCNMGSYCFEHECYAFVLPKICSFDNNQHCGLSHLTRPIDRMDQGGKFLFNLTRFSMIDSKIGHFSQVH